MESEQLFRRYWIFQGMPERYDLAKKLIPQESESWPLTRYYGQVKQGDIVYFWRGGRQAGLYGWGKVSAPPYQETVEDAKDTEWQVNVTYQKRFSKPIPKNDLLASNQSVKLAGLLILRAPQGTSFKVTTHEAINLNQLIHDRSEEPPVDPLGSGTSRFPALSLAPLSLGRTVSRLVGAGILFAEEVTREPLEGNSLLSVLLSLSVSSEGPPRGTAPFLHDIFSRMELPKGALMALARPLPISDKEMAKHFISDETLDIMESARLLAIYSTRREVIGVRHLFGGLLLSGHDRTLLYADVICRDIGNSLQNLVEQFIEHTVSSFPNDDSTVWMSQFRSGTEERLAVIAKRQKGKKTAKKVDKGKIKQDDDFPLEKNEEFVDLAGKASVETSDRALAIAFSGRPVPDRPFGADLLQIESEYAALAHLFALREKEDSKNGGPDNATFALGLFGRWGAGKSFFIEKLKKRIEYLSENNTTDKQEYCKEIVQIDFNAWHYNEADIWASLVHHIFDTLQKHFQDLKKEIEFKNLLRQLEISQERRNQLEAVISEKETQRDALISSIDEQESEINTIIEDQMQEISTLPERLAMNSEARDKLLGLLPQAAEIFGLPTKEISEKLEKGEQNAAELLTVMKESGEMVGHSKSIGKTILRSGLSNSFLLCGGIVLLIYFALPELLGRSNLWDKLLTETGQVIALVTPALIWLRTRLVKASNIFNQIEGVEAMLREDLRTEQEQKNTALVALRDKQERLSGEISNAVGKRALLDKEIFVFKNKLEDLGSAESLVDYINDRATSDDYRSKLGILALIRRDFEKLSNLMTTPYLKGGDITGPTTPNEQLPHIDRIILYIDDLDRVQDSKKVLQVLEAVHLLLAFPLFHVVVAVDERWAARSVLSHHSDFFEIKGVYENSTDNNIKEEKVKSHGLFGTQQATPREFLEKIFQISFWVRPLSIQLTEELIEGVVNHENLTYTSGPAISSGEQTDDEVQGAMTSKMTRPTIQEKEISPAPGTATSDIQKNEEISTDLAVEEGVEKKSNKLDSSQDFNKSEDDVPTQVNFKITGAELVSMRALSGVIGRSPRTVKRFINTYRLFKAMDIPMENGGWDEEESNENNIVNHHVPIMVLLAIQIGHPDIAVLFFEQLDKALSSDDSLSFGKFLEDIKEPPPESDAEKRKWLRAINALGSVSDLYAETPLLKDLNISALSPWLLGTSRFGFQEWVSRSDMLA